MQTNRRPGKRAIFCFLGLFRADFATGQTSYGFRTNAGVDCLAFFRLMLDRSCSFTFHNLSSTQFSSTEFVRDGADDVSMFDRVSRDSPAFVQGINRLRRGGAESGLWGAQ